MRCTFLTLNAVLLGSRRIPSNAIWLLHIGSFQFEKMCRERFVIVFENVFYNDFHPPSILSLWTKPDTNSRRQTYCAARTANQCRCQSCCPWQTQKPKLHGKHCHLGRVVNMYFMGYMRDELLLLEMNNYDCTTSLPAPFCNVWFI